MRYFYKPGRVDFYLKVNSNKENNFLKLNAQILRVSEIIKKRYYLKHEKIIYSYGYINDDFILGIMRVKISFEKTKNEKG